MAGCCTVPTPSVSGLCIDSPTPFLAGPEVLKAWAGKERYFDAHTHFFNASDVPVEQFLAKSVARLSRAAFGNRSRAEDIEHLAFRQ